MPLVTPIGMRLNTPSVARPASRAGLPSGEDLGGARCCQPVRRPLGLRSAIRRRELQAQHFHGPVVRVTLPAQGVAVHVWRCAPAAPPSWRAAAAPRTTPFLRLPPPGDKRWACLRWCAALPAAHRHPPTQQLRLQPPAAAAAAHPRPWAPPARSCPSRTTTTPSPSPASTATSRSPSPTRVGPLPQQPALWAASLVA